MTEIGDEISAEPTKRFFVDMLTRDISLEDALLDLLDNCVDGIIRSATKDADDDRPYCGFYAHFTISPTLFSIRDNCGGIPKDTLDRAFRMGRPQPEQGSKATVGMYGIGMKRALFKLGTASSVASQSGDFGFTVEITPKWMEDPDDWKLPLTELNDSVGLEHGTLIKVSSLRPDVSSRFDEKTDNFIAEFRRTVAAHYAIILGKGFSVTINEVPVEPSEITLLMENDAQRGGGPHLTPYIFRGEIDGVDVEIYAGLYRPLPSIAEIEKEEDVRSSKDRAGWSIICNDRVVVHRDKTRLTGWGEASVPAFHGQFMSFSGVVIMRAADPWKLPLTTTKRGIDASTNLYSTVKDFMREATKAFTTFTNRWKRHPEERTDLYKTTPSLPIAQIRAASAQLEMTKLRKVENSQKYVPNLPLPSADTSTVRISYVKPRPEFQRLALALFETDQVEPRDLGIETFDFAERKLL